MLVILGGLPGVGKTTIARELARQIGAMHLRVDSVEHAIQAPGDASQPLNDVGYRIAYAVAADNLPIGQTVIADSVNSIQLTRNAWLEVANRAKVKAVEIEITCVDLNEHRRRVEARITDITESKQPTWQEVVTREYHPWGRNHIVIDTSGKTVEQSVDAVRVALAAAGIVAF
jgi:predicted kinase